MIELVKGCDGFLRNEKLRTNVQERKAVDMRCRHPTWYTVRRGGTFLTPHTEPSVPPGSPKILPGKGRACLFQTGLSA